MAAFDKKLYIVKNAQICTYSVSSRTGSFLGKPEWGGNCLLAPMGDGLCVYQSSRLHRVDTNLGTWQAAGSGAWANVTALTTFYEN